MKKTEEEMPNRGRKLIEVIKTIWQIVGVTILLFATIEIALTIVFVIQDSISPPRKAFLEIRSKAESYRDAEWNDDLLRETSEAGRLEWEPYIYWRRAPFVGDYITVNENGLRITTNKTPSLGKEVTPVRIFMFGGSTMWGSGARDSFTIPSLVSQIMSEQWMSVYCVNYG